MKKQVTDNNVSTPVGMTPLLPPTGMPMSHQQATPGEPRVLPDTDDVPHLPADPVAEPFGTVTALAPHEVGTSAIPATLAETAVPRAFERLEPVVPAESATLLEPRTVLARLEPAERGIEPLERSCCQCCGDTHDGQEDRPFERGQDRAHDGEPRLDDDGVPARDLVHDTEPRHVHDSVPSADVGVPAGYGEPRGFARSVRPERDVTDPARTDGKPDSCCCCCGGHHDFERPPGEKNTATDAPVTDGEDDDRCGPDGDERRSGRHDDKHDDKHDGRHDDKGDGKHDGGKGDGRHDPDGRGTVTPGDERPWKRLNERPVTEPGTAYAVRHRAPDATKHTPGATMAPPPATRLEKPVEPGAVQAQPTQAAVLAPRKPATTTSTVPAGQTVPTPQPAPQPVPGNPPPTVADPSKPAETAQGVRVSALAPTRSDRGTPASVVTTRPDQNGPGNQPAPTPTSYPGLFTSGGTNGQATAPPSDGNVGPDPNVKFDEGQYNQLINVIADVEASVFNSVVLGDVYLGSELKLQPSGQKWTPASDLVANGSNFGNSVDTQTTSLSDSLSSFHDALEEAKAVFKHTDDLAAYDATKFTTEYPGFNSGGLPGS